MDEETKSYLNWFKRQTLLPELGEEGQLKLRDSRVLIVGAGGLGCPVSLYLTTAGVGNITIIDGDKVEKSNLHRQVLFGHSDIGKPKAEVATEKLAELNPWTNLKFVDEFISLENIEILKGFDLVIDGTDNFSTKYLLNDASREFDVPFLSCSIDKFQIQLGLFNTAMGPSYRCLFPEPPNLSGNCSENGVAGPAVGVAGSYQALEAIKFLAGIREKGSFFLTLDLLGNRLQNLDIHPSDSGVKESYLRDQSYYAALGGACLQENISSLTLSELEQRRAAGEEFTLVDVRSKEEHQQSNIGGRLIPHKELIDNPSLLPSSRPLVLYCATGKRSSMAWIALPDSSNVFSLSLSG